jgi:hypothetical protein
MDRIVYTTEFTVPVSELNPHFTESSVARIPIRIDSFKGDEQTPFFTYQGAILLLPKYPVQYELIEHATVPIWSSDLFWSEAVSVEIGPTGEEFRWVCQDIRITLDDNKLIDGSTKSWTSGSHTTISGAPTISNAGRSAQWTFCNQVHDNSRRGYGQVQYRVRQNENRDLQMYFRDDGDHSGTLTYGTTYAQLSPGYNSYTLRLTFFNGNQMMLFPGRTREGEAEVTLENTDNFKRVVLSLRKAGP